MITHKLKLNALLIDDDATTNLINKKTLQKTGVVQSIQITENGREALDYLIQLKNNPDLIILDINMPIMNGWEFLAAYQKINETKKSNLIVVPLTTSLPQEDYKKANDLAPNLVFVDKPLRLKTLHAIIQRYFSLQIKIM